MGPDKKGRPYGRYTFALILVTWWILGLFGLESARRPSIPLVAGAVSGLVVTGIVSSARRRRDRGENLYRSDAAVTLPRSCVVIRLGEGEPSAS